MLSKLFRSRARFDDPDPENRRRAVVGLSEEDAKGFQADLAELARTDADRTVRRAALGRLIDPAELERFLAERGYVVLTYDVQGQGTSETFPHEGEEAPNALPFCNPFAEPQAGEMYGCPGVPAQQLSNFVVGTRDALSFFTSTPGRPYPRHGAEESEVSSHNPYWRLFDRSRDRRTDTPGRTKRIAIIGHSLGAAARRTRG